MDAFSRVASITLDVSRDESIAGGEADDDKGGCGGNRPFRIGSRNTLAVALVVPSYSRRRVAGSANGLCQMRTLRSLCLVS